MYPELDKKCMHTSSVEIHELISSKQLEKFHKFISIKPLEEIHVFISTKPLEEIHEFISSKPLEEIHAFISRKPYNRQKKINLKNPAVSSSECILTL